jgi:6-phosphogluconate dehydrogenase
MEYGIIGLGRMGAGMARRLLRGGQQVVVHDRLPQPIKDLEAEGAACTFSTRVPAAGYGGWNSAST